MHLPPSGCVCVHTEGCPALAQERIVRMRRAMAAVWPRLLWSSARRYGRLRAHVTRRPYAAVARYAEASGYTGDGYIGEGGAGDAFATFVHTLRLRLRGEEARGCPAVPDSTMPDPRS